SEAIFALAAHSGNDARAFEALHGTMATAWLDEREPDFLFAARGVGRPLWLGEASDGVFFASTAIALEVVERYCVTQLRHQELDEGTSVILRGGKVVVRSEFRMTAFVEENALPPVRAPEEREFCLTRLATIAARPSL